MTLVGVMNCKYCARIYHFIVVLSRTRGNFPAEHEKQNIRL